MTKKNLYLILSIVILLLIIFIYYYYYSTINSTVSSPSTSTVSTPVSSNPLYNVQPISSTSPLYAIPVSAPTNTLFTSAPIISKIFGQSITNSTASPVTSNLNNNILSAISDPIIYPTSEYFMDRNLPNINPFDVEHFRDTGRPNLNPFNP